ncbi:UNVERIFIED_CONTAM: hypothetical protein GTU68_052071 [Idotea baltica]|nr:hypothetical protein [Idotea baltica]
MLTLPPRLRPGDTIAVFSPSSPTTVFAPTRFQRAKEFLQAKGFRILEGSLTGKADHYRSGSVQDRVAELNALIHNPEVKAIMSTIGGYNSNSMLPYIDYAHLKAHPKIVTGYSDMTAILQAIQAQANLVTYYGPALVASFGELPPLVDETYNMFEELLVELPALPYTLPTPTAWTDEWLDWEKQDRPKITQPNQLITVMPGKAEGKLVGGNLNTMSGFFGSKYMPPIEEGDILLLEDCLSNAQVIERSFAMLKLQGVLDRVGGIILGKHEKYDDQGTGRKPHEILMEILNGREMPFLAEFDIAHTHPMVPVPLGIRVSLDADKQKVSLLEAWTKG